MKKRWMALAFCLVFALTALPASARLSYAVAAQVKNSPMVKSGIAGQDVHFSAQDFKKALGITGFDALTVTSLPDETLGVLKVGENRVEAGASVSRENVARLTFSPAGPQVQEAAFSFTCDGYCGGEAIECHIKFGEKVNNPPTVEGVSAACLSAWTYRNTPVWGQLQARDPEGDELTFAILAYPKKGSLVLEDAHSGVFCYTPGTGKKGQDGFTYAVMDEWGNWSESIRVSLTVERAACPVSYTDLGAHPATVAAAVMTEAGIMSGTIRGAGLYFDPEETVSREEFVVMAMKALGLSPRSELTSTFFDDDASLTPECKPYVATAQQMGWVIGDFDGKSLCFSPAAPISRGEAADILCRMSPATRTDTPVCVFADLGETYSGTAHSLQCLSDMGAFRSEDGRARADDALTRGEAAVALLALRGR